MEWSDYALRSRPVYDPNDYTARLVNQKQLFEDYINMLKEQAIGGKRFGRTWRQIWGYGKSIFLFNVCDSLNRNFFWGEDFEVESINRKGAYERILAIFLPSPQTYPDLLMKVLEEGFKGVEENGPVPSSEEYVRRVALLLFRKCLEEVKKPSLMNAVKRYIKDPKSIVAIDKALSGAPSDYILSLVPLFKAYLRKVLKPISTAEKREIVKYFPLLLFRVNSTNFNGAYTQLVRERNKFLLNLSLFNKLLKSADVFVFWVFDQLENAKSAAYMEALTHISTEREFDNIHFVLVERSDLADYVSRTIFRTYETIRDRTRVMIYPSMKPDVFTELTEALLSKFRDKTPIPYPGFPYTQEVIKKLTEKSRNNPRDFLMCIVECLPEAKRLELKEITAKDLENPQTRFPQIIESIVGGGRVAEAPPELPPV